MTTRAGVIDSVVEERVNGLFMEIGDADSLTRAMLELLENPGLRERMAESNRAKARSRFDISVSVERLTAIFEAELEKG